jgi:predicted DNA-binding protein with PD1-like motif
MNYKISNDILAIRLYTGEDLIKSLTDALSSIGKPLAVVLSGVGMLKEVKLGYFKGKGRYKEETCMAPAEILSLTGNIINNGQKIFTHLHVSLADESSRVFGGHLMEARVHGTGEIFIQLSDMKADRKKEEETELEGLKL